jgi:hypothetical protein
MRTSADCEQERDELERVLASGIFHRAPNLALVLKYVCAKHFEGASDKIKEYNIAVDALGRRADFDQKRDSIVRVEAHRLRKRLREYYESAGADHPIHIEIPSGQYAPRFIVNGSGPESSAEESEAIGVETEPDAVSETPRPLLHDTHPLRAFRLRALLILVCSTAAVALWNVPKWSRLKAAAVERNAARAAAGTDEVRILAGHLGSDYTDRRGRVWQADRYFQGGYVFEKADHPIYGTREPGIYQSRREGAFQYDVPLAPGSYELRLHFAETLFGENNVAGGGESSRVFNVLLNDREILREFDIVSEVGPSTADIRAFKDVSPAADGKLHLRFESFTGPPLLCAIEITPGIPGRLKPIRMVAFDRSYTDGQGRVWEPDRYARSGQLVARTKPVRDAFDPELFKGERFGNLRYVIPVPPGRYAVTIHSAEAWFGPGTPAGGGAGSRLFDILANGVVLRRGFDVFKEAGGAGRATAFTAHGLEPDARGKLNLTLEPSRNYACVNAIEVLDESK